MGPDTTVTDSDPIASPDSPVTAGGGRRHWRTVLAVIFFALLAAHILFLINPRVLYQADEIISKGQSPIPIFPYYYQGMAFFEEFIDYPGGVAEYAGANVGQYFGVPYGGAVVLVVVALAAFLVTDGLITLMGGRRGLFVPFVPPLLMLVMWNQYTVHLGDMIGVVVALLAACAYLRLPDKLLRALAYIGLLAAVCYVGGGAFMLTAAVCGLYELLIRRRRLLGAGYLLAGAAVWAAATRLTGDGSSAMVGGLTGAAMKGSALAVGAWVGLHLFYLLLMVGMAFARPLQQAGERLAVRIVVAARPIVLILLTVLIAGGTYNVGAGEFRRLSYAAQMEQWGLVLKVAHRNPGLITPYVCRAVNRALYEAGKLTDDMFAFPQIPDGGLLPRMELDQPYKSDTLLKLGAVNRIEHLALESKEIWGPRPFVIRLLARIALAKGEGPTARVWLSMLSKDIVHQSWAIGRLQALSGNPSMAGDEEVQSIRAVMLTDERLQSPTLEAMLLELLQTNPGNKMAFEYLMAHYLLVGHLDGIVAHAGRLTGLGYKVVPDHIGEAILLYEAQRKTRVELALELSPRTMARNLSMTNLSKIHGGSRDAMSEAMRTDPELAGSYFRYYIDILPSFQIPSYEP